MITLLTAMTEVRSLINVPAVTSVVDQIIIGRFNPEQADKLFNENKTFIVVSFLTLDFEQVQEGVVNVNIYKPFKYGVPDYLGIDEVFQLIKPLLEDATTNNISTSLGRPFIEDMENHYTMYNQRVNVMSVNVDQYQNNQN